ncbi:MAG TPA: acetyl-CoA carboxylase carboxyltransferase subunit alpha [Acidobacteriaceae bacterium]|nr:acetyl-CoA carboxylase carboxyltransferase subunit alpha [Acidobacteriaceae bacterium]
MAKPQSLKYNQAGMAEHETHQPPQEPTPPAWAIVELARHPQRPDPMSLIESIFTDRSEIHGDRAYADDPAMYCALARFEGEEVMVIGNVKGRTTKEKVHHRFGMPDPDGYRKALRAMKLAEKFGRPVFTFIDLMGAYPGMGAEERGQAEAIARNLREMSRLRVPTIATITGEGGSGGALALAVADRVLIMEKAIYSVISPESCAAIMWRDASRRAEAAVALKSSAPDLKRFACVDDVVPEPGNGAHENPEEAAKMLREKLTWHLKELKALPVDVLVKQRYEKFRNMAQFYTA